MADTSLGFGVTLTHNGTPVAELVDFEGPELTRGEVERTHHGSPNRWQQFRKGLKNGGTVTFTIHYDPTDESHFAIVEDITSNDDTIDTWGVIFPDPASTTWTLPAFVIKFKPVTPKDGMFTADVDLKVAGEPNLG